MQRVVWAALLLVVVSFAGLPVPSSAQASPVVIAIIDTGIDASHGEFEPGQVIGWFDAIGGAPGPVDPLGHGTAVASLAAGATVGTSPGTPLLVARVCDAAGCPDAAIAAAIQWAVAGGATVINLSLGTIVPWPGALYGVVEQEIWAAHDSGVQVVVSAGNGLLNLGLAPYPSELGQPSGVGAAFVVGAADPGTRGAWLGGNVDPEVVFGGVNMRHAVAGTGAGYAVGTGTSFAAPGVSGIVAEVDKAWRGATGSGLGPGLLELMVRWTTIDHAAVPPTLEGTGYVDAGTVIGMASSGNFPPNPCDVTQRAPADVAVRCPSELYVIGGDQVRGVA